MTTHVLKCHPEPFEALALGTKTFEFRKDDRGFQVGDLLRLREYDPAPVGVVLHDDQPIGYTGRELTLRVTYLLRGPAFGVPADHVVMSLSPIVPTLHHSRDFIDDDPTGFHW